jgi:hypothetical protein
MRISDHQIHQLYLIAMDSLGIVGGGFCFDEPDRRRLLQAILDQQDKVVRDMEAKDVAPTDPT